MYFYTSFITAILTKHFPFLLLSSIILDVRLAFCDISASETCCTNSMEKKLASNARTELERNTKDLIGKLASVLSSRAIRFDGK